jgi:CP family cyanate transporter-like MFS transporter
LRDVTIDQARAGAGPVRLLWFPLVLLWLAGIDLRLTMLAVPPLLPLIHRDLGLSETGVAVLTGLPVFLLAAAAIPGSLLIARLGARRAMVLGIVVLAVSSAFRGAGPSISMLFAMTFVMAIGIAVAQPAMPSLVQQWAPAHIGLATAIYANGILVGETLAAALTLPFVLPLAGGTWELSLAAWGAVVLLTVVPMAWPMPLSLHAPGDPRARWWPDWKNADTWKLGFLQGGASMAYFGSNAFMPDFLRATGRSDLIGACLTALNAGQLPASLLAAAFASAIVGRRAPLVALGAAVLVGLGVFLLSVGRGAVLGAGMLGFCFAFILVLSLALPPLLAERDDVHRLSAGMYAVGYALSFATPVLGGAIWDLTHRPAAAFVPVALGALTVLATAATLPARRAPRTAPNPPAPP